MGARAFTAILRVIRRNHSLTSAEALAKGIAQARRAGPVLPGARMRRRIRVTEVTVDGFSVFTLKPSTGTFKGKHVLYLHGGAFVRSITRYHWQFLKYLVEATGATITVPLYPLTPEYHDGDAHRLVLKVHERVAETANGEDVVIMGDSAGANLALTAALALRDARQALPQHLILIAPWVDVTLVHPGIAAISPLDPMLAVPGLREAGRLYAGDMALDHPYISPLHADLSGLPSMTIYTGTRDILYPDTLMLAEKARQQGADVELIVGSDMIHDWPILPFAEGRAARSDIAARLAS
jgi:acetyl esterase/lipase